MKRLILVSICFLLTLTINAQQKVYVNAQNLNFRSDSCIISNNVISKLAKGTEIQLLSKSKDWSKIDYKGTIGYVATKYISYVAISRLKEYEEWVYICNSRSSYAYHSYYCHGLKRCKAGVSQVDISKAKNRGYRACGNCYR